MEFIGRGRKRGKAEVERERETCAQRSIKEKKHGP